MARRSTVAAITQHESCSPSALIVCAEGVRIGGLLKPLELCPATGGRIAMTNALVARHSWKGGNPVVVRGLCVVTGVVWMCYLVLVLALALVVSQPAAGDAQSELRTWHSSDGNYAVRAALLDTDGQQVRLRKPDGSIVTVPLARLSAADREFLAAPRTTTPSTEAESASEQSARAALESLGLRIGSSGLMLADESKLGRMMREVTNLRKNVMSAESGLAQQERKEAEIKRQLTALLALDVNLNAQLAHVRLGDTAANNRLVATINANRSQLELLRTSLRQQGE